MEYVISTENRLITDKLIVMNVMNPRIPSPAVGFDTSWQINIESLFTEYSL